MRGLDDRWCGGRRGRRQGARSIALGALTAVTMMGCADGTPDRAAIRTSGEGVRPRGLAQAVAGLRPSVVTIATSSGSGSGVVLMAGGIVVTNEHVVAGAQRVEVVLADGSRVAGRVAATDRATDLAVVRAERRNLPAAKFQTVLPRPGEPVIAMGGPPGFEGGATAGIVSGLGRQVPGSERGDRSLVDLIQIDAAVPAGGSGGALANARAEVVGINEAYQPPEASPASIGFAIPAATVVDTANELLLSGRAANPYFGVVPTRLTEQSARALRVGVERGVVVSDVAAGSPAAVAGLRRGDVITTIGGRGVASEGDLFGALRGYDPGDQAAIVFHRAGRPRTVNVIFGRLPG